MHGYVYKCYTVCIVSHVLKVLKQSKTDVLAPSIITVSYLNVVGEKLIMFLQATGTKVAPLAC